MKILRLKLKIKNYLKAENHDLRAGLSLIELLVASAIFAVCATIAVGALLAVSDAQQKIVASRITQDNLSYAFDTIGKEIRTGTSYHCGSDISTLPQDCPSGNSSFTFINAVGQTVTYRINSQRLEKIVDGFSQFLTSPNLVIVDRLVFYAVGAPSNDNLQPRMTIVLRGRSGEKAKTASQFNIQTTISQRILDS